MFRNYLKTALRNLWKYKSTALINILGMSLAVAVSLLLIFTAHFEFSYDNFHENGEDIFRLFNKVQRMEGREIGETMPAPLQPALLSGFEDIKYAVRYLDQSAAIEYKDKRYEYSTRFVDQDFFHMFSFPLISGTTEGALSDRKSIVITQKVADAIFKQENPIGKSVSLYTQDTLLSLIVSGIAANPPDNSSIDFDLLTRFENEPDYRYHITSWDSRFHNLFVQLHPNTDKAQFEKRLNQFVAQQYAEDIEQLKAEGVQPDDEGNWISSHLQPIDDLHAGTMTSSSADKLNYPIMLLIVSVLLMLIASFNFVNLNIARFLNRAKEAGMRKTLGASRYQIILQFTLEALIICMLALVIGSIVFYDLIPEYNSLFYSTISLSQLQNPMLMLGIVGGTLMIAGIAGLYPAWWLSRLTISTILKGSLGSSSPQALRNTLLVFQFAVASLLITCTLTVWQQIDFLIHKPLGYNQEAVISIPIGEGVNSDQVIRRMRKELGSLPEVQAVTAADDNLGMGEDGSAMTSIMGFQYQGRNIQTHWLQVDYDYLQTLDISLLSGRDFSSAYTTDSSQALIINESMARHLQLDDPIGALLPIFDEKQMEVIGVMKDFHFESLRTSIEPLSLTLNRSWPLAYIFVKTHTSSLANTMKQIETVWKQVAPQQEFLASYLDDNTERMYRAEKFLSYIFMGASLLAILIACMGLFAIALLTIRQKRREISIRKVLGATVSHIVLLLSGKFVRLVLIAIGISVPLGWYAMNQWLSDFAYRIPLSWWLFGLTALLATGIALLTITHSVPQMPILQKI